MCQDLNARIIIKQGSGVPTIPASTDHRNGDWIATDIYEGELYLDNDTGFLYTSNSGAIKQPTPAPIKGMWKAQIAQTGTSAPVIVSEFVNTLGVMVVPTYSVVGAFGFSGFAGLLVGNVEIEHNFQLSYLEHSISLLTTPSLITLATYSSGVLANDVIVGTTVIRTITVTVY